MNKKILEIITKTLAEKQQIAFDELWDMIKGDPTFEELNFNDKSRLYLELSTNKLFVNLGNNVFSLRSDHKYGDVVLPTNKIYIEEKEE